MATFLLDTDTLSLFQRDHPTVLAAVAAHSTDIVAICTTTLDEQIGGWSAIARSAKTSQSHEHAAAFLVGLVTSWQSFALAPQTVASLTRFDQLRKAKLNVGGNDLRIAALALELGATVFTRNHRDFGRVHGLGIEDWSV